MPEKMTEQNRFGSVLAPCVAGFLQFSVRLGDMGANLDTVKRGLADLDPGGPGVVVLPELWSAGFAYDTLHEQAAKTPALIEVLARLAAKYGVHLAGSLPELVLTDLDSLVYNTLFTVGPHGVVGSYRKQQLFAPIEEDRYFTAGDDPQPVTTELGRIAGLVCYDLRFPDLAASQAASGAGLLLVSAQWPGMRKEHWRTLLRSRAIENQMFVAACNRCGTSGNLDFAGHSMVVAPDGTVLAEAGEGEEAAMVDLDPALLTRTRARFNTAGVAPYRFHDQNKIIEFDDLRDAVARYKAIGRRVVFTNGCFDILHPGHVSYLEAARKEGDCLIVGLNSDASVRSIKGPERPINHEQSRARLLAGLGCVDHVVLFSEETPRNLITTLLPDVLVKGGDWPVEKIVGAAEVAAAGGKVLSIPLVDDFSTTALIEKISKINSG